MADLERLFPLYSRVLSTGAPQGYAEIAVFESGTSTLAAITELDGTTPKANPFDADEFGLIAFMVPAGSLLDIDVSTPTNPLAVIDPAFEDYSYPKVSISGGGGGTVPVLLEADLPDPADPGALALVSDRTRGLWHNTTGSEWVPDNARVCNIMDFGAVGDGVTDDRAAIQAAIDAAGIGGTVYIPESQAGWLLDSTTATGVALRVNALRGIKIIGGGLRSCLLMGANAGLATHALYLVSSPFFTLRDFSIGTKVSNQTGDAIRVGGNTTVITKFDSDSYGSGTNNCHYGVIENVWANGMRFQVAVLGGQSVRVFASKIQAPSSSAGPYAGLVNTPMGGGVYVNGGAQAHGFQLIGGVVEGTGSWGVYMRGVLNGKILGATCEGNGDGGAAVSISSSTNASPIVLTLATPQTWETGQQVYVADHLVNTAANGIWSVTRIDSTHYSLDGSVGNGVGAATGTVQFLQGDVYLQDCTSCVVEGCYSETGVSTTRNYLVNGGRLNALINSLASGGVTHFEAGDNHQWRNVLLDGIVLGPTLVGFKAYDFEYASSSGAFIDNAGTGVQYVGTITNGSNVNQQRAGVRYDSPINYARNGGFERWITATSLDGQSAGPYAPVLGATVVRSGDGESDTTKIFGRYSAKVTAHAVNVGSGLEYQGPIPRYVDDVNVAITISVWAKASAGTVPIALGVIYNTGAFHSVGFTATTTAQKFSATFPFREGCTAYSPRFIINDTSKVVYFDAFFVTDGRVTQLGDWDNAKLQEVEPQGCGIQTFAATPTFYGDTATFQKVTLAGNITAITLTGWIPGVPVTLLFVQGGGGNTVAGWPASVKWNGGAAPTVTATAGAGTAITLVYDGTSYWEVSVVLDLR